MSDTTFGGMARWLSGFISGAEGRRTHALARRIVGKDGLDRLETFFEQEPEEVLVRERTAAIEACIWVAQADRQIADAETVLLEELIANSELPWSEQKKLMGSMRADLAIEEIAERLTQAELRELIFAMAFRLTWADGRFDAEERTALRTLASALGIDEDRERRIERATRADAEAT